MMRRDGREPCKSFLEAFELSEARLAAGWEGAWDYKGNYLLCEKVRLYLELFPPEQLFIRRYEELNGDPEKYYRDLMAFIGVPPIDCDFANERVNVAPRRIDILSNSLKGKLTLKAARLVGKAMPFRLRARIKKELFEKPAYRLTPKERSALVDFYADDIRKLGSMLHWDLSNWLRIE